VSFARLRKEAAKRRRRMKTTVTSIAYVSSPRLEDDGLAEEEGEGEDEVANG